MGIISAISKIADIISAVFSYLKEARLREEGFHAAMREVKKKRDEAKKLADDIDSKPLDDPNDILNQL